VRIKNILSFVQENRLKTYLFVGLLSVALTSVHGDRWWPQWATMTPLLISVIGLDLIYNRSKVLAATFIYFGINAAYTALWRMNQFEGWALMDRLVFQTASLDFLMMLGLYTVIFAYARIPTRGILKGLFFALLTLTTFQVMFMDTRYGFLGNYGMNTSLLAVLFPFAQGYIQAILVSVAVIDSGATTPLLVWGVVLFSLYRKGGKKVLLISGLVGAGTLLLVWQHPEYLNDSTRFQNWKQYLEYFWEHNVWFGNGAGTFKGLGPMIQGLHGEKKEFLFWAHNEYLEVLFEYGIVGFTLFMSSLAVLVRFTYTIAYKGKHRAALFGIMACGLTDYPLRLAVFVFVIVLILRELVYGEY
jgi:O-antigen ligase